MATETSAQPLAGPFTLVYDDGDRHTVIATTCYDDGSFDVRPIGNSDPYADWTVFPVELRTGVVTIEAQTPGVVAMTHPRNDATGHLVDENGSYLCPEAEARDAMDDGEFWDHVANRWRREPLDADDNEDLNIPADVAAEFELEDRLASPCPECGEVGACSYDAEGRALIHVTGPSDGS